MKGKAGLVVGMAAGYVLGARDGRGRYEEIKTQAERLWNDPKVQQKAAAAQDLAKQKAPQVSEKLSKVAGKAGSQGSGSVEPSLSGTSAPVTPPTTPSTVSAPKSVTPASVPVAKGPELHTDTTASSKPGGLDG